MNLQPIIEQLDASGLPQEALGVWRRERKIFGVARPPVIDPSGHAWRVGALLIGSDGSLYATGKVTRAVVPKDFNSDKSVAGEERREIQRAAARGTFCPGESVNYEWVPLTPDEAEALVAPLPLEQYIAERLDLLG